MIKGVFNPKTYQHKVYINGKQLSIRKTWKLHRCSHDFNWGYGGAGPNQLSFALLLELTNEKIARALCDTFEKEFLATLQHQKNFDISEDKLMNIIFKCAEEHRKERKRWGWDKLENNEIDYP